MLIQLAAYKWSVFLDEYNVPNVMIIYKANLYGAGSDCSVIFSTIK